MVSEKQAYEWVKTGHWTLSEFSAWMAKKLTEKYSQAFDEGYQAGAHEQWLETHG